MARRVGVACALVLAVAAGAHAQSTPSTQGQSTPSQSSGGSESDTRPATTTFFGDTGLWYVPTAEVLPAGKWSVSGYRRGTNFIQGYTNVADFAGTFGVGIKNRAEIFGSFLFDTRIDRDVRPLFSNDLKFGGIVDRYPRVAQPWTGDNVGDFYVGAKINLWSEYRQNPAALAVRGMVKLPTGDKDVGVSTGKADFLLDLIASKELRRMVEISGNAGYEFRGSPDDFDAPGGAFRWGVGAGFPSRSPLRGFAELNGVMPSADQLTLTGAPFVATDYDGSRSVSPITSSTENLTRATIGAIYQTPKGVFFGAGLSWNVPRQERLANRSAADDDPVADYWDWQVRIGYHPGVRVYVPPPPPEPPAPPPPPPPPAVHNLAVRAACDPCTVEVGRTSTVTATVEDSISCAVTYRWTAPNGTLATPANRQSIWTAPQQEGAVPVMVTVTCPSDNKSASDTVNIQVVRPPVRTFTFEDVHFDFDRYTLRTEATRALDEAVTALRENATLRITIEGHTCNIGTAEYNLALGERRGNSVRDYLVSRGVSADRLQTVSYGEERPKYDNSREETRRLNRRAALVVRLQ